LKPEKERKIVSPPSCEYFSPSDLHTTLFLCIHIHLSPLFLCIYITMIQTKDKIQKGKLNKEDRMEFIPVLDVYSSYMLRFYGCVFFSISLSFVHMTSSPRSIGGVPLGRDLLLRIACTSMHSRASCNWRGSSVAVIPKKPWQTMRGSMVPVQVSSNHP